MFGFKEMLGLGHPSGGLPVLTSALLSFRFLLTQMIQAFPLLGFH